ncbi:MAG: hypothetical protein ACREBN_11475 [Burkholderiaceae bacterium]
MKNVLRSALALTCLSSIAWFPAANAEYKCTQPHLNRVDKMACAKGAEDVESLRRFVAITQRIYGLQASDYVLFEDDARIVRSKVEPAEGQKNTTEVATATPVR